MNVKINTKRLTIRNITTDDLNSDKFISEYINFFIDKEKSPLSIYDEKFPADVNEITKMAEGMQKNNHHLAICLPPDDTFIGYIFHIDCGDKNLGIGYAIHSDYQNKGYGTEACGAFIDYVFANTDFECVNAGTANNNKPSVRMLEKLNFTKMFEHNQSHRKDENGNAIEFVESLYSYHKNQN